MDLPQPYTYDIRMQITMIIDDNQNGCKGKEVDIPQKKLSSHSCKFYKHDKGGLVTNGASYVTLN